MSTCLYVNVSLKTNILYKLVFYDETTFLNDLYIEICVPLKFTSIIIL